MALRQQLQLLPLSLTVPVSVPAYAAAVSLDSTTTSTSGTGLLKLARDFPDPSIVRDSDGKWYAFATASGGARNIQAASAPSPSGPWTYIDKEILPSAGNWTLGGGGPGSNTWAPDVRLLSFDKYVMYYAGQLGPANASAFHCIGAATATSVLGPYSALPSPLACPVSHGGAIDPSGFLDENTGRRYVVYKVDGNSLGHGGECNNGVAPYRNTPIVLQEVDREDGVTLVGDGMEILDRLEEADGPLVEAPSLGDDGKKRENVTYVLFYSSHCWMTELYRVNYATARNVTGPYVRGRKGGSLIATGDGRFNLTAPGGATSVDGGGRMLFHANCAQGRYRVETSLY
ncbi:glycosyl hydrolase family 43 protein [Apodospora peruviana]|uniref:Glycosyl hydrolase family 43 protein n=1 Tax=Apodospora peruviana TaxID=516989 RepID=A0AAE0IK27_9PEZI|nr:glycosyl hydrolase family 43 protein [Apodospora peruviana]